MYIIWALRRQQVDLSINPAEDNNNIYDCFCAHASFDAGVFFMSVYHHFRR